MRIIPVSLACSLFVAAAPAQEIVHESLTTAPWSRGSGGTWNSKVANTSSLFNAVDHLVAANTFSFTRLPLSLDPGYYVAVVRFSKRQSTAGSAPVDIDVIANTAFKGTTPVVEQTVDSFIHSKALLFSVSAKTAVLFQVQNTDPTTPKQEYFFDSFYVGKIPEPGPVVHVESLTRRWGHAWGAPHYCKEIRDTSAIFGFVEYLNPNGTSNCGTGTSNLWWFEWNSKAMSFLPGVHTGSMRIKKVNTLIGAHDFEWFYQVSTDNGATWKTSDKIRWNQKYHTVNDWIYSPNIAIDVTNPSHLYRWRLHATGVTPRIPVHTFKADYYFDAFIVRRGDYSGFGVSCMNNGQAEMRGNIPQLGEKFDMEVSDVGTATNVSLILGVSNPALDLGILGWTGCFQYASLTVIAPMPVAAGQARLSVTLPKTQSILGVPFYTQAYTANANGVTTTNGVRGEVGS